MFVYNKAEKYTENRQRARSQNVVVKVIGLQKNIHLVSMSL
jgi:hypothetical protein